jgi:hypothetical protein
VHLLLLLLRERVQRIDDVVRDGAALVVERMDAEAFPEWAAVLAVVQDADRDLLALQQRRAIREALLRR